MAGIANVAAMDVMDVRKARRSTDVLPKGKLVRQA
jgi:hypothetical protein